MLVKLSSKGQLIIPKSIRRTLGLQTGGQLHIHVTEEHTIVLKPIQALTIDAVYGKYPDTDFLADLAAEHQMEIAHEATLCS